MDFFNFFQAIFFASHTKLVKMSTLTDASKKANCDLLSILRDNMKPAQKDRFDGGSGSALAHALWRAAAMQRPFHERVRVFELGGKGFCFTRVLALHVLGTSSDSAVAEVLGQLANALACERVNDAYSDSGQVFLFFYCVLACDLY